MELSNEVIYAIMNAHELANNGQPVVVRVTDWSQYEDGKSNNGGCYLYYKDYEYCDDDGKWYRSLGCSCELYHTCPVCGFDLSDNETHWDEENQRYICGEFPSYSTDELLEILQTCVTGYSGSRDDISIQCV